MLDHASRARQAQIRSTGVVDLSRDSRRSRRRPGCAARPGAVPVQAAPVWPPTRSRGARAGRAASGRWTSLFEETITTKRSAAAASAFSRVCAPPPPLTSQPDGAAWSAPSIVRSRSWSGASGPMNDWTSIPSSRAARSVAGELVTHRTSSRHTARAREQVGHGRAGPQADDHPALDELGGASAAARFSRSKSTTAFIARMPWPRRRPVSRAPSRRVLRTACAWRKGRGRRSRRPLESRTASRAPRSIRARGRPPRSRRCGGPAPFPESDTPAGNSSRLGERSSASAVRSRSQEPITLPRRQTSATSVVSKSYW